MFFRGLIPAWYFIKSIYFIDLDNKVLGCNSKLGRLKIITSRKDRLNL